MGAWQQGLIPARGPGVSIDDLDRLGNRQATPRGGVPRNREIEARILGSASRPIFWPFVGIGGRNHGVLEKLDHLSGRIVDNCIFFALDDRHGVSEGELYDHPLNEFPSWLNEARRKGLLARGPTRLFLHPLATH